MFVNLTVTFLRVRKFNEILPVATAGSRHVAGGRSCRQEVVCRLENTQPLRVEFQFQRLTCVVRHIKQLQGKWCFSVRQIRLPGLLFNIERKYAEHSLNSIQYLVSR